MQQEEILKAIKEGKYEITPVVSPHLTDTGIMMSETRKSYDKPVPLKEGYEVSKDFDGASIYPDWKRSLTTERW